MKGPGSPVPAGRVGHPRRSIISCPIRCTSASPMPIATSMSRRRSHASGHRVARRRPVGAAGHATSGSRSRYRRWWTRRRGITPRRRWRATNEAVLLVHWVGGRHTEVRVARVKTGRYPADRNPSAAEVIRKLGGQWSDRDLAVTMNRMRCKTTDGETWTTVRVRHLRERLGVAGFDPDEAAAGTISVDATAHRLGICVSSVHRLIREGVLPATQLMPSAPWQVSVSAFDTEVLKIGLQAIIARRPIQALQKTEEAILRLPGF